MLNKIREQGFLLFEMLAAMAVSTIILVTAARFFPALGQDVLNTYRQYKLDTIMRETLLRLEKDLRRTAFCRGHCQGNPLQIAAKPGETRSSCIIVAYDLNHNGRWERNVRKTGEHFGYRLNKQAIEWTRNALSCRESGWEKVTDNRYVAVSRFLVTPVTLYGKNGLHLTLTLTGLDMPLIQRTGESLIVMPNYHL
ncbi:MULTISPECIES: prepilin peptidase-dependent protein [unclassified Morganella (in: enterobacteria)]|uniref:prepilin peptidase-dependent protein n=1 Tax=unclassified Morganella (in: enterobacteria) TaxID=2676694 RepID=UPI002942E12B|nr:MULTISPECIES: prepilin peptidase-dependent protein [unclassified Morganella (in: enterobacteria)]